MTKQFTFIFSFYKGLDFKGVLLTQLTVKGCTDYIPAAGLEQVALAGPTLLGRVISEMILVLGLFLQGLKWKLYLLYCPLNQNIMCMVQSMVSRTICGQKSTFQIFLLFRQYYNIGKNVDGLIAIVKTDLNYYSIEFFINFKWLKHNFLH